MSSFLESMVRKGHIAGTNMHQDKEMSFKKIQDFGIVLLPASVLFALFSESCDTLASKYLITTMFSYPGDVSPW